MEVAVSEDQWIVAVVGAVEWWNALVVARVVLTDFLIEQVHASNPSDNFLCMLLNELEFSIAIVISLYESCVMYRVVARCAPWWLHHTFAVSLFSVMLRYYVFLLWTKQIRMRFSGSGTPRPSIRLIHLANFQYSPCPSNLREPCFWTLNIPRTSILIIVV